jgi:hypothetical protein
VPLYLNDSSAAGGRRINPAALSVPIADRQGDLGRTFFLGFLFFQTDVAVSIAAVWHLTGELSQGLQGDSPGSGFSPFYPIGADWH